MRVGGELTFALALGDRGDRAVRSAAEADLTRLLPRLKPEDFRNLDKEQRAALAKQVLRGRNADLTVAILRAFGAIGGASEQGSVTKAAHGRARTASAPRVRAAAEEALAAIRSRVGEGTAQR